MTSAAHSPLIVSSPAFDFNGFIPSKYTRDGVNINPELRISELPGDARDIVLIMEEQKAFNGAADHWIKWNIPPVSTIEENTSRGATGKNSNGENKYDGPCSSTEIRSYHFKVYALDTRLDLPQNTNKKALLQAMDGHVLASGQLIGLYKS